MRRVSCCIRPECTRPHSLLAAKNFGDHRTHWTHIPTRTPSAASRWCSKRDPSPDERWSETNRSGLELARVPGSQRRIQPNRRRTWGACERRTRPPCRLGIHRCWNSRECRIGTFPRKDHLKCNRARSVQQSAPSDWRSVNLRRTRCHVGTPNGTNTASLGTVCASQRLRPLPRSGASSHFDRVLLFFFRQKGVLADSRTLKNTRIDRPRIEPHVSPPKKTQGKKCSTCPPCHW